MLLPVVVGGYLAVWLGRAEDPDPEVSAKTAGDEGHSGDRYVPRRSGPRAPARVGGVDVLADGVVLPQGARVVQRDNREKAVPDRVRGCTRAAQAALCRIRVGKGDCPYLIPKPQVGNVVLRNAVEIGRASCRERV